MAIVNWGMNPPKRLETEGARETSNCIFPNEILFQIFFNLDAETRAFWSSTCKLFRNIAYGSALAVPSSAFPALKSINAVQKVHFQKEFRKKPALKQEIGNLMREDVQFKWLTVGSRIWALESENDQKNFFIRSFDLRTEELNYLPEIHLRGTELRNFVVHEEDRLFILSRDENSGLYLQEINLKQNYINDSAFIPKLDETAPCWSYLFSTAEFLILGYELPQQSFAVEGYSFTGGRLFQQILPINVLSFKVIYDQLFFADETSLYHVSVKDFLCEAHTMAVIPYENKELFYEDQIDPLGEWLLDKTWSAPPKYKLAAREVIRTIQAPEEVVVYFDSVLIGADRSKQPVQIHAWDSTTGEKLYSLEAIDSFGLSLEPISAFAIGKGKLFGFSASGKIYTWEYVNIPLQTQVSNLL